MDWTQLYPNPHTQGCFWHDVAEKMGSPNIKWCEETLCQAISEPANTWSNLAYILVGAGVLALDRRARSSNEDGLSLYPWIIGIMGFCSLFYHASNVYPGQILDFVGMFLMVGWCLGMNLVRLKKISDKTLLSFVLWLTATLTVALHVMYLYGIKYQALILLVSLAICATELMGQAKDRKWFTASAALVAIALGFSYSDGSRLWCDPSDHILQGHAMWHVFSGLAMLTIWLHYRQFGKGLFKP